MKTVLEAINDSGGIKQEVAKRLGCSRKLLYEYAERFPEIKEAFEDEGEKLLDMAESVLFSLVQDGELAAVFYVLNNKGGKRGYGQQNKKDAEDEALQKPVSGVLVTPGLLNEAAWEKAAGAACKTDKKNAG